VGSSLLPCSSCPAEVEHFAGFYKTVELSEEDLMDAIERVASI
jgi:hypothetical protein